MQGTASFGLVAIKFVIASKRQDGLCQGSTTGMGHPSLRFGFGVAAAAPQSVASNSGDLLAEVVILTKWGIWWDFWYGEIRRDICLVDLLFTLW